MPEFVDNTVKDIDEQLRQLRDEVSRLEAARSALTGGRRGPGRPRGSCHLAPRVRAQHSCAYDPRPHRPPRHHARAYPIGPQR